MLTRRITLVLFLLLAVTALAAGGPATAGAQPTAARAPDPPQSKSALRAAATADPVSGSQTALVLAVGLKADSDNGTPWTAPDKRVAQVVHEVVDTSRPWFQEVSHGVFGGFFALGREVSTVQTTTPVCSPEWRREIGDKADAVARARWGLEPSPYGAVFYYSGEVPACNAGWAQGKRV